MCVFLAAAPTTPPCFRHWRRSSLLHSGHIQRKIIFYFAFGATAFAERSVAMKAPVGLLSGRAVCVSRWLDKLCGPLQTHFHGWGRKGKQPLHTLASSPSQSLRATSCKLHPKTKPCSAPHFRWKCGALFWFHRRGGRGVKRHLQRRFLRKRSAAGKVCTGFQRAEPSLLRCAQHGTMRSISARNSRFFVSTCDNSSLSADRLIYLFISVLYHFCGYIAIVRYCLSLQFCLLPFR